jgi:acetylornithine/succinyldiaminopimelate/putrescine aminotransferase
VPGFRPVHPEAVADAVDDRTAAVLVEPVQGESGVHPLPPDLLRDMREACDRHDALLIFDEVQCGMGRTGTLFAYEAIGVRPDLMTLAKGLGGGFPVGALVATPECSDVLVPGDHGTTFGGTPLASAAANAVLDVVDDPQLLRHVVALGARLAEGLRDLPAVTAVRGRGLMVAADVAADAPGLARRALLEHRLVINATGPQTLRFLPPLVITEEQIDDALGRLERLLSNP